MRYKISRWYLAVLALWCVTGLPVLVIGIGMAGPGGSVFDWLQIFIPDETDPFALLTWAISLVVIFYPLIILPMALRRSPVATHIEADSLRE